MSDSQARIDELEARLAFQDDSLQALNDVVARQDKELSQLRRELAAQGGRLKGLVEQMDEANTGGHMGSAADEVPPHY